LIKLYVKQNAYYDSVSLMLISRDLKKLPGVGEALVGLGTELNKELCAGIGLASPELEALSNNDFFVAADCAGEDTWQAVLAKVEELLGSKKKSAQSDYTPPNLAAALKASPELNLAVVSVPGAYAADVARDCLERGVNVLMFSDNVSAGDELSLKQLAVGKGLLMMGPDCGTAILNGVPLAFANVVARGDIGIVAASGTGAQEVSTLIDRLGGGITQLIGTGGRDLKEQIGGLMYSQALDALINDSATKVIVLISKPPSVTIADKILTQAKNGGKPVVVCFVGDESGSAERLELCRAVSLEDAAHKAVALS